MCSLFYLYFISILRCHFKIFFRIDKVCKLIALVTSGFKLINIYRDHVQRVISILSFEKLAAVWQYKMSLIQSFFFLNIVKRNNWGLYFSSFSGDVILILSRSPFFYFCLLAVLYLINVLEKMEKVLSSCISNQVHFRM